MDIDEINEMAIETLKANGKHQPQLMTVHEDNKIGIILMEFSDGEAKDKVRDEMRQLITKMNIDQYFFVSEAFMSVRKPGDLPFVRPMRDAKRKECLMVSEFRRDQKNRTKCTIFHWEEKRNKKRLVIEDEKSDLGSTSLWNFFLEKEGLEERSDKLSEKSNDAFYRREAKIMTKKFQDKFNKLVQKGMTDEEKEQFYKEMCDHVDKRQERVRKNLLEDVEDEKN